MREIKFRAWNTDYHPKPIMEYFLWFDVRAIERLRDKELMQFTGLKDKNGKEIYEGDIVGISGSSKKPFIIWAEMKFNCGCCSHVYGWEFVGSRFDFDEKEFEVFGNIYENPGLKALTIGS